jgi:RHS repeat-associated protein
VSVPSSHYYSTNTQTCNFAYDDLARLAGKDANGYTIDCGSGGWQQLITLDPFGNISKSGSISFAASYLLPNGTTNNQEQSVASCVPTYDANGNMTKDCSFSSPPIYTWDSDGNPIKLRSANLTFDAFDREVETKNGTTITQILYSPIGKLGLMNGQSAKGIRIPLPGGSTAEMGSPGAAYILHSDWLGSARLTTNYSTRAMTFDTAYAPYGEAYASTSGSTTYLDFTGQFQDTMTGLHDFLYREYDPVQGRWISPDPAGLKAANPIDPQSWNRYPYVANAPLSATDPLGLESSSDGCFGGDLGDRFECILPDGGGSPSLAGDPGQNGTKDKCGFLCQIEKLFKCQYDVCVNDTMPPGPTPESSTWNWPRLLPSHAPSQPPTPRNPCPNCHQNRGPYPAVNPQPRMSPCAKAAYLKDTGGDDMALGGEILGLTLIPGGQEAAPAGVVYGVLGGLEWDAGRQIQKHNNCP